MGEGVRYLIVHEAFYKVPTDAAKVMLTLQSLNLVPVARLHDGYGTAVLYELQ
jgi:hypothetical protein